MGIGNFLISCLFPKRCRICDEVIDYEAEVCSDCVKHFSLNSETRYIKYKGVYSCFSPFCYEGRIRDIILKFKFNNYTKCVDFFAKEMAKTIYTFCDVKDIDFICFVPMTERSVAERGYNQSEILAKSLGKTMKIPVNDVLLKLRETMPQHRLSAKDREYNLFSAFSACKISDIRGKSFILCDDIITTGNTLKACVKALKDAGANRIVCCTIARTLGIE